MVNLDSLKVSPPDSVLFGVVLQSSERQDCQRAWAGDHMSSSLQQMEGAQSSTQAQGMILAVLCGGLVSRVLGLTAGFQHWLNSFLPLHSRTACL